MPAHYGSRKYDPLGIDPDALRYIAQSGARDRNNINRFVRGVKSLGLWSSMVCWPLRSSQNAGTGTTAFSLGGLGTYNGTLVNGPTWGDNGITFATASVQRVLISNAPRSIESNCTVMSVQAASANTSGRDSFRSVVSNGGLRLTFSSASSARAFGVSNSSSVEFYAPFTSGATAGVFEAATITTRTGAHQFYLGITAVGAGSSSADVAGTGTSTAWMIGAAPTADNGSTANRGFDGTHAGVWAVSNALTLAEYTALYNLYKSTLGTGLSLA